MRFTAPPSCVHSNMLTQSQMKPRTSTQIGDYPFCVSANVASTLTESPGDSTECQRVPTVFPGGLNSDMSSFSRAERTAMVWCTSAKKCVVPLTGGLL